MSTSAAATHTMPAAIIIHSVASIRGPQHGDISVYHARTPDARISVRFGGILMVLSSCHAAQGLLEAFAAARAHMARLPREIPAPPQDLDDACVRVTLSMEWTRRPDYAVVTQSSLNKLKNRVLHWVELYTGPITWQIRDQVGLLTTLELLSRIHQTAAAVFPDGEDYRADPTDPDHDAA